MKKVLIVIFSIIFVTSCNVEEKNTDPPLKKANGYWISPGGLKYKLYSGGIFKINEINNFKSLFPHSIVDAVSARIGSQIYQGLFKLDQRTLEVKKCLASSYEENDDGTVITIKIHDNIFFHDNPCFKGSKGRNMTAHDAKYAFDMLCEKRGDNSLFSLFVDRVKGARDYYESTVAKDPLVGGVPGITVLDDYTIKIELEQPCSFFKKVLTHNGCWIFPREAYDKYGEEMRVKCVGTGPFVAKDIKDGSYVRLVKNKTYWEKDVHGNQLPYLDVVKITFSKDKKTELANFRKGNLDMVWVLPVEDMQDAVANFAEVERGNSTEFEYQQKNGLTIQYYSFLTTSNIFSDKRIRMAFNYAIDREALVKYTLQGEGEPALHGLIPKFKEYDNSVIDGFTFDKDKAKKLLKEAGYPNGNSFPAISLHVNQDGTNNIVIAEAIQHMLKENLGIDLKIEALASNNLLIERFQYGKTDFFRTAWVADYPDPENFLKLFYSKTIPNNPNERSFPNTSRFSNADFDNSFEIATTSMDSLTRITNYQKCDSILIAEAAFLPLYYEQYIRMLQKNIMAFPINGMEYRDLSRVFISKDE
jgi:peptide/nickel transport system substrate-binding protein